MTATSREPSGEATPVAPATGPIREHIRPAAGTYPPTVEPNWSARPGRRLRLSTVACFGLSVVLFGLAIVSGNLGLPIAGVFGIGGAVLFGVSIFVALWRALRGLADLVQTLRGRTSVEIGSTVAATLGNLLMAYLGMLVAYFATVGFSRGRQLRRRGKVLLPNLRSDSAWTTAGLALACGDAAPAGVADQWRENGKTEHASVAAFARVTLDLIALGAPPTLIADANQDALDEIRHAQLCFSLARAIDGKSVSPAPFPQAQRVTTLPGSRPLALAKLAVDSLIDGALHEGVSARIIAKLGQRCETPAIRAALKEIAADEGRHAAHGWAVVEWCLAEGGATVGAALIGAVRVLPEQMNSALAEPASKGEWERWGIHGHDLENQEYLAGRKHVVGRVYSLVGTKSTAAA